MAHVFQTFNDGGKPHPRWRFEYRDRFGRKRKGTGYSSKGKTLKLAQSREADEEAIRKGYKEAPKPSARLRVFDEVAQEYLAWGDAQGGRGGRSWGTRHSLGRHRHMDWWKDKLGFRHLSDMEGCLPLVEAELRERQKDGLTGRTVAQYAESLSAFAKWCVAREYMDVNPLRKLSAFDTTPQVIRRALTPEEVNKLLNAAPIERRILYQVALCTGLRANELRNLTVDHLDIGRCGLRLDAAWTKNRKPGFQPLPAELVHQLVAFVNTGQIAKKYERYYVRCDTQDPPQNRLFYILSNPVKAFDDDLKAAGIPKKTNAGKLDFHSLRVAYATFIVESGATVKEAQTLLRHSSPDITMNTYARVRTGRLGTLTEQVAILMLPGSGGSEGGQNESNPGHDSALKSPQSAIEGENGDITTTVVSDSCRDIEMVEAAGIEPASEGASSQASTCVAVFF